MSEGQVLSKLQQVAIKAVADPQFSPVGSLTWSDAAKFTTSASEGGYDFSKLWAEFLDPVFEQRARSVSFMHVSSWLDLSIATGDLSGL